MDYPISGLKTLQIFNPKKWLIITLFVYENIWAANEFGIYTGAPSQKKVKKKKSKKLSVFNFWTSSVCHHYIYECYNKKSSAQLLSIKLSNTTYPTWNTPCLN